MAEPIKWAMDAEFLQACNCEYGCPCEFEAPPSHGTCEGTGQWQISKGHYGEIKLDGLGFGFAAVWPGPLHKGGGTCALFVDQRATQPQRDALLKIASGEAGGMPFEVIRMTMSKLLPPQFVAFEFHSEGKRSRGRMGDQIEVAVEPIKNPVTGAEESVRIEHQTGFIFKIAECVSSKTMRVATGELNYSYPNRAAFVAKVHYSNG
jgi:hypothetical protein